MVPPGSTRPYATVMNNSSVLAGWAANERSYSFGYGYFTHSNGTSTSIDAPPNWWLIPSLLAPGLVVLAAMRRRFKK